jgi:hypothetical protein
MAEEQADDTFVHGMGLTEAEIDALDRYIGLMEQATKNPKDFARSEAVAFTPRAMLAIAVAEFAGPTRLSGENGFGCEAAGDVTAR